MRIVDTDNFGGDYPVRFFDESRAKVVADALNGPQQEAEVSRRYWKVVPDDYKLQPGFEP